MAFSRLKKSENAFRGYEYEPTKSHGKLQQCLERYFLSENISEGRRANEKLAARLPDSLLSVMGVW